MICSKFLPFEVVVYLYRSTIQPCMECFCHVWIGVPSCYLNVLEMLQKWLWSYIVLYRTVGPTLAASCMECCCHVWIGAPSCYLNILEMLQKWVWSYIVLYRTVGPTLAASVEPLVHLQNVANPGVEISVEAGQK